MKMLWKLTDNIKYEECEVSARPTAPARPRRAARSLARLPPRVRTRPGPLLGAWGRSARDSSERTRRCSGATPAQLAAGRCPPRAGLAGAGQTKGREGRPRCPLPATGSGSPAPSGPGCTSRKALRSRLPLASGLWLNGFEATNPPNTGFVYRGVCVPIFYIIYTCIYMCLYVGTVIYVHLCIYIYGGVCVYIFMRVYICICAYVCVYNCIYVGTFIYVHVYSAYIYWRILHTVYMCIYTVCRICIICRIMHIYMCIYIQYSAYCIYVGTFIYVHVYSAYICIYVDTCVYVHIHIIVPTYIHIYMCTFIYGHAHTNI